MTTKYKKTKMGYMIDLRGAMARISESSSEWCKAFDSGDSQAVSDLAEVLKESMDDLKEASEKMNGAEDVE